MLVFIGDRGLCPICGEAVQLTGATTDGRLVGSCGDAFWLRQWAQDGVLLTDLGGAREACLAWLKGVYLE